MGKYIFLATFHHLHTADCFLPLITALLIIAALVYLVLSLSGCKEDCITPASVRIASQPVDRYAVIHLWCLYNMLARGKTHLSKQKQE